MNIWQQFSFMLEKKLWEASKTILLNIHTDIHLTASHGGKKLPDAITEVPVKSMRFLGRLWEFASHPELTFRNLTRDVNRSHGILYIVSNIYLSFMAEIDRKQQLPTAYMVTT